MSKGLTPGDVFRLITQHGLENALQRFYSSYSADVVEDNDPQQQGRVKVCVSGLGMVDPHVRHSWPISPYAGANYGFYFPPHAGEKVLVSFDQGSVQSSRVVGSWWRNGKANEKPTPEKSEVPAEFVDADGGSPTRRGIKTKGGHGLLFEDNVDASRVEMWSGTNNAVGSLADKHHTVRLDDTPGDEKVVVASFKGHKTTWQDKAGDVFVETVTTDGHKILMSDTNKQILIKTKLGHQILVDDDKESVSITTVKNNSVLISDLLRVISLITTGNNSLVLSDDLQSAALSTAGGRKLDLNDKSSTSTLSTTSGQSITQSETGTAIVDTAPISATSEDTITIAASGLSLDVGSTASSETFAGALTRKITGALVETLSGGWIADVVGAIALSSNVSITLDASSVVVGSGVVKRLVNEDFFSTAYSVHTHTTTLPGVPTSPPITGLAVVGAHTTVNTVAS